LGSDHRGYRLKQSVTQFLHELGHQTQDFGCLDERAIDYPDVAIQVARAVAQRDFDHGVLICGTGIGMTITANKIPGIRAALCTCPFLARLAREHNDANILCMGGEVVGRGLANEIVATYLSTSFEGDRHVRRIEKISNIEKRAGERE
jgi:ribose 5-phosphate isomerase B